MGIFDKKTEEEKIREIFHKYGLDLDNYNNIDIKKHNIKNIQQIASDVLGQSLNKLTVAFAAPPQERIKVGYLSAIFNQNWILIRQNELIIRILEKIADKK